MLHKWSAGHFSPSRFVFVLCGLVCFACVFSLVLFFGFWFVTEL